MKTANHEVFINFGHYAFRAWGARDHLSASLWEAWFEIYTPDHLKLLFGPTKLHRQYGTGEEAFVAAKEKAELEISQSIGGQT